MKETDVVCECFNVTYKDIKDAIKNGAKDFNEVQKVTKAGTGCEGCISSLKELINSLIS